MDERSHLVAMPMLQGAYVERLLAKRGVDHEFWDRAQVAHGECPMPHRVARAALRRYRDCGIYDIAPVVVRSGLDEDEIRAMVAACMDDPGFRAYVSEARPETTTAVDDAAFGGDLTDEEADALESYGDLLDAAFVTDTR